jgi:hypothetical protein
MKLNPVQHYDGAQYPCLAEYFNDCRKVSEHLGIQISIALAILGAILGGCSSIS